MNRNILLKEAEINDFDAAFQYIEKLWSYNTYERDEIFKIYQKVLDDDKSFAFFAVDDQGNYHGFCHGDYFYTFWMSGLTCYISSLITNEEDRGKGYGKLLLNHARELAEAKECKALILDSGLPRSAAHGFYENYGFEKSCYGFELIL